MYTTAAVDDPHERNARAHAARALAVVELRPSDPSVLSTLAEWQRAANALLARDVLPGTRLRLADHLRVAGEMARVLSGEEEGEGRASERRLVATDADGRVEALCTWFTCPGGIFIELLVTAPWNLLRGGDPHDARAVRGAGAAIVNAAAAQARRRGGRVALQAENRRAAEVYGRWGFAPMTFVDRPLDLVPPGDAGWSESIVRVARGSTGAEEARMPWLVTRAAAVPTARAADAPARSRAA
jgi:GNAT superfamily N-acetyltransferase